jgi:hypothetical protein
MALTLSTMSGIHGYGPEGDGFANKENHQMAPTQHMMSGLGAQLDEARQGLRGNYRAFNTVEPKKQMTLPLHPEEPLDGIVQGDLVSELDGKCCSFEERLPFAGVAGNVGQDNKSRMIVSVFTRGCFHGRVEGLSRESRRGTLVYAEPGEHTQPLNVLGRGVLIGALFAVESLDRSIGIICFKASGDEEPFINARSEGGPLR